MSDMVVSVPFTQGGWTEELPAMVPVVSQEELYAQDLNGSGHVWKKQIEATCKKYRLTIQTFFFHAAHSWFTNLSKRRRRKEARKALSAFYAAPTKATREPMVAYFARAFAAILQRMCPQLSAY